MKYRLLAVAILLATGAASASDYTGQKLLTQLRGPENGGTQYELGLAQGYITGVADVAQDFHMICPTETATRGQAYAIVQKYLEEKPENWDKQAFGSAIMALMRVWPCKKD